MIFSYITWDVSPEIFTLGPVTPRWYGLLFASGFLAGLFMVREMFKVEKAPEEWLDKAFMYIVIGGVVGARLGHVFFYDWDYYSKNLLEIPAIWRGGLASHGGAIGILIAIYIFSRLVTKKPMLWMLDKVVVPTALAALFIRLGNFINSEIVGTPHDGPLAVLFVRAYPPLNEVPRHPVQLYEGLSYLIIFIILFYTYWRTNKREKPGFIFGLFLVFVFGVRFFLEKFKHTQGGLEEAVNNTLSTGQILSIPFVLIGLYFIFRPTPKNAKK
ncbi:MAG: prolipoprotein diacylglyceryl transferase [Saprospiraceae bacterium]